MDPNSVSRDGKRIAFAKWVSHTTIYMTDLDPAKPGLLGSRHFVLDEANSRPLDWTGDGQYLLFSTDRDRRPALFRQHWNGDTAEALHLAAGAEARRFSPDGKWILGQREGQRKAGLPDSGEDWELTRTPAGGGPSRTFARIRPGAQWSCARPSSRSCVLAEAGEDRSHVSVRSLDPLLGPGKELARFESAFHDQWSGVISPDGGFFATITGSAEPILILSLRGQTQQQIAAKELTSKSSLQSAADGKGLFVTNAVKGGADLYYVTRAGEATKLWHNDGGAPAALPSPDGKHLAIQGASLENNIWLMELP